MFCGHVDINCYDFKNTLQNAQGAPDFNIIVGQL